MTRVEPGDLVFSFCDTLIKAVDVAQGKAQTSVRPEFGSVGDQWEDEGWLVEVEFQEALAPVKPKNFIDELHIHIPAKYSPLQANGNGNQWLYLVEVSEGFAEILLGKLGSQFHSEVGTTVPENPEEADDEAEQGLRGRTDIGPTQITQLGKARRGQGVFRKNVRLNETSCRVTGVSDPRFLVASHIKPWRLCNDQEKLDGCNGLLLSPHVDKLFDSGFMSFAEDGSVIRSDEMPSAVWESWRLTATAAQPFNDKQHKFLAYHRAKILK
jgi:HNH endonuclease